jgi:tetratricopeptide (TPR) repeat protein
MKNLRTSLIYGAILLFWSTISSAADAVMDGIVDLQHSWAKAYYQVPEEQKESAFKELAAKAHQFTAANAGRAEPMVWEAIILSSYAKFAGGLSALGKVKDARDLLERAEKLNPTVLDGSVYASLGSLYYKVPRWPIAFGDKDKAREYLEKALHVNPTGIDPNYFYGDFLLEQGEYGKAREYLEKALAAPARPGRADADQGRRAEVEQDLEKIKHKG